MNTTQSPYIGATGEHVTDGLPHTSTSLTPFLTIERAAEAVEFYRSIFGARVVAVTEVGGVVVHAELDFGSGKLQIGEDNADYGLVAAPGGDSVCYSMGLYCTDVDAVVARAEDAGATVREEATDFVSGDRFASIRDPFGVRWSVMMRVEDISEAESAKRVAGWASQQEASATD